MQTKAMRRLL